MDSYECSQSINVKTTKKACTPSPWAQHLINFKFFFEFKTSRFLLNLNPNSLWLEFTGEDAPWKVTIPTSLTVQQSLSYEVIQQGVERVLTSLPLFDNVRQQSIEFAWKEISEIVRTRPQYCYKVIDLDFQLLVHNQHVFGWEEAFQTWKKDKIDSWKTKLCSHCSEDLSKEAIESKGMPCEQVFHGCCIYDLQGIDHRCQLLEPLPEEVDIEEKLKLTNS